MSKAQLSLKKIMTNMKRAIDDGISRKAIMPTGLFIVSLIQKRTRLGYGVSQNGGDKKRLKGLTEGYIAQRARDKSKGRLSSFTSPGRSNLTRTGQLLDSLRAEYTGSGSIRISPSGLRFDGRLSNLRVAQYQEDQGRVFNRVSKLEFNQAVRFYRRTFGDLLKKRRVIT